MNDSKTVCVTDPSKISLSGVNGPDGGDFSYCIGSDKLPLIRPDPVSISFKIPGLDNPVLEYWNTGALYYMGKQVFAPWDSHVTYSGLRTIFGGLSSDESVTVSSGCPAPGGKAGSLRFLVGEDVEILRIDHEGHVYHRGIQITEGRCIHQALRDWVNHGIEFSG